MKTTLIHTLLVGLLLSSGAVFAGGGGWMSPFRHSGKVFGGPPWGPRHDRPFPVGQVTETFWEIQQTNAEAGDFIFHEHEFVGNTAVLAPGAKRHLESIALRLEHVPFPIVIEQTPHNMRPQLDRARQQTIIENLNRMGITNADARVIISNAFPHGFTSMEAEAAYYQNIGSAFGGGAGRRFGGTGGFYR